MLNLHEVKSKRVVYYGTVLILARWFRGRQRQRGEKERRIYRRNMYKMIPSLVVCWRTEQFFVGISTLLFINWIHNDSSSSLSPIFVAELSITSAIKGQGSLHNSFHLPYSFSLSWSWSPIVSSKGSKFHWAYFVSNSIRLKTPGHHPPSPPLIIPMQFLYDTWIRC